MSSNRENQESQKFDAFRRKLVTELPPIGSEARQAWSDRLTACVKQVFPEAEVKYTKPGVATRLFSAEVALPWAFPDDLPAMIDLIDSVWKHNFPETAKGLTNNYPDRKDHYWEFACFDGEFYVSGVVKLRTASFGFGGADEGYTPRAHEDGSPRPERNDRDRGDRPSYGGDRDRGDRRPPYRPSGDRPNYGGDRKPYGGGGDRPNYGGDRKPYGDRPNYGGDRRPQGDRPNYGGDRPNYGGDRKPYGDRPNYGGGGGDRKPYGDRPNYGGDRRPQGDRPNYGGGGDRPNYGDRKPYGGSDRPNYGGDRKPYGDRPSYGDRKPYGGGGGDRKPYGKPGFKPGYGGSGGGKPPFKKGPGGYPKKRRDEESGD